MSEKQLLKDWKWGNRNGAYGPHGGHCFISKRTRDGAEVLSTSKGVPVAVVTLVLDRAGKIPEAGVGHFRVADLRVSLANEKMRSRQMEVERDQARGSIESALGSTGCPSLGVLSGMFEYYRGYQGAAGPLLERLSRLDGLPVDLALEIKAVIGKSPDEDVED